MSNNDTLVVNPWASMRTGCDISFTVFDSEGTFVTVPGTAGPFECFVDAEALRDFLARGQEALAEMDELAKQEEAQRQARSQAVPVPVERRSGLSPEPPR